MERRMARGEGKGKKDGMVKMDGCCQRESNMYKGKEKNKKKQEKNGNRAKGRIGRENGERRPIGNKRKEGKSKKKR